MLLKMGFAIVHVRLVFTSFSRVYYKPILDLQCTAASQIQLYSGSVTSNFGTVSSNFGSKVYGSVTANLLKVSIFGQIMLEIFFFFSQILYFGVMNYRFVLILENIEKLGQLLSWILLNYFAAISIFAPQTSV